MISFKRFAGSGSRLAAVFVLGVAVVAPALGSTDSVSAGTLTSRKIQLSSNNRGNVITDANGIAVTDGAGGDGGSTRHVFSFQPSNTTTTYGSMVFMYCTTPFVGETCTAPTNMNAATVAAIQAQTNFAAGAWSIDSTVDASAATGTGWFATDANACSGTGIARTNCILVDRASGVVESGATVKTLGFGQAGGWIKNPESLGTFYVRMVAFSDTNFTTPVEEGTVAAAITDDITITSKVQEKLNFSVSTGTNVAGTTCQNLPAGSSLALGDPGDGTLSPTVAYDQHSYFRVNTNSGGGTVIQYTGDTLKTVGGVAITSIPTGASAILSALGTEQFGLGFNSADGAWSATHLTTRTAAYNAANGTIQAGATAGFMFSTASTTAPVTLASSAGIVGCDTLAVRYLGNISTTTRPGIYRTSIGYIATPTY